jgi:hypothetical protein
MTKLTSEQVAQLTPNGQLLHRLGDAIQRGDDASTSDLCKKVIFPAEALLAAKRNMGAEWIRNQGFRTETAEAKYGKDWLDREI